MVLYTPTRAQIIPEGLAIVGNQFEIRLPVERQYNDLCKVDPQGATFALLASYLCHPPGTDFVHRMFAPQFSASTKVMKSGIKSLSFRYKTCSDTTSSKSRNA